MLGHFILGGGDARFLLPILFIVFRRDTPAFSTSGSASRGLIQVMVRIETVIFGWPLVLLGAFNGRPLRVVLAPAMLLDDRYTSCYAACKSIGPVILHDRINVPISLQLARCLVCHRAGYLVGEEIVVSGIRCCVLLGGHVGLIFYDRWLAALVVLREEGVP